MAEDEGSLHIPAGMVTNAAATQIRNKTPDFRQVYANNVQIGFSNFDIALSFGQISGEEEGKTVVDVSTHVIMSRELAKLLAGLLVANIKAYEQQFGEIVIPQLSALDDDAEDSEEPEQAMTEAVKKAGRRRK